MNPINELGLPEAPPVTPDIAGRALQRVLVDMDAPASATVPRRRPVRRWGPLLTAAAVVLVAVVVAAAITLSAPPDAVTPATVPVEPTLTTGPADPLPPDQLPPTTGLPDLDTALARCATAVVGSGRAAEYPPVTTWSLGPSSFQSLNYQLVVNEAFACRVTVDRVAVSGTSGTPVGGVQVVQMSPDELVVLDPDQRGFEITAGGSQLSWGAPVTYVELDDGVSATQVRIAVGGGDDGPLPEPVQALAVTDRELPAQDPAAPGASELAACIARRSTDSPADQSRWLLIGRHDTGDAGPGALIARIDGIAAGVCVPELDGLGQEFVDAALPPPSDDVQVFQYAPGPRATVALATVPAGVTRLRMSPVADPAAGRDCTIVDGLAVCTLDLGGGPGPRIVVTAFTEADPDGREVYRN